MCLARLIRKAVMGSLRISRLLPSCKLDMSHGTVRYAEMRTLMLVRWNSLRCGAKIPDKYGGI